MMAPLPRGFEVVVDALADAGVTTVFGLMGDDTAALISDLPRRGIAYRAARHENAAVGMADGYAWATGRAGVAILSRGPGLTNAMTGLASVARRSDGVLAVVGDARVEPGSSPRTDPKAGDQVAIGESAGMNVIKVTQPDEVLDGTRRALAAIARGTATLLVLPSDIQAAAVEQRPPSAVDTDALPHPSPGEAELDAAADLLEHSSSPLILAGRGAHLAGAAGALASLAERSGALLGTTLLGVGMFHDDPYSIGIVGGFASETALRLVAQSDVVFVVGASLSTFTTEHGQLLAHARVIQVDLDPDVIGAMVPVEIGITGDARTVAEELLGRVRPRSTDVRSADTARAIARELERPKRVTSGSHDGLDPVEVVRWMDRILPERRVVVTDGGHNLGYGPMYLRVVSPDHYRHSYAFGAIGMGLGVALGAAAAERPDPVILVIGDGGLSMSLGDLSTAVEYSLPLTVVVFNDRAYGAERHFLDLTGRPSELTHFAEVDFAAVARALGWRTVRVQTPEHLLATAPLLRVAPSGPLLVDVRIDPAVRARWIEPGMVQGHDG